METQGPDSLAEGESVLDDRGARARVFLACAVWVGDPVSAKIPRRPFNVLDYSMGPTRLNELLKERKIVIRTPEWIKDATAIEVKDFRRIDEGKLLPGPAQDESQEPTESETGEKA